MVGVIATPGKSLQLRMRCKTAFILIFELSVIAIPKGCVN